MSTCKISARSSRVETLESLVLLSAGVSDLEATHKDGQTFLTWQEDTLVDGEQYHVYRHDEAITADNLSEAELLTAKWGPLADDTSRHQLAGSAGPRNFVIEDLGQALNDDTGLFVYTTQPGESGPAYYAVQLVIDGVASTESNGLARTSSGVDESEATAAPILVESVNNGKGLLFTQFMDYKAWNPTFQGYAYNYAVALPEDYDPAESYSLKVTLHAYNEGYQFLDQAQFGWDTIQLFVDDPGADRDSLHTWWYGFAADHDFRSDGDVPIEGVVANFTEQRVLRAIDEVVSNTGINVDTSLIHAVGHSMGGSGALSLGIRYGDVFSSVYSSQGMTDYAANPVFQNEFERIWGTQASNLQIVNGGPHSESIRPYGAGGDLATGVWDWLDHGEQLIRRRGESVAFLMFGHGKDDTIIDWATQGRPFPADVETAGVAYTSEQRGNWTHNWMGYEFAPHTLVSDGYPDLGQYKFRNDHSYLALSGLTANGDIVPGSTGSDFYNLSADWSTDGNQWDEAIVDTADRYEVSIRSFSGAQTTTVTPRNLQGFRHESGTSISWQNVSIATGQVLQSGVATVDDDGLLTVENVQLDGATGSRLTMTTSANPVPDPVLQPTPEPDPGPAPQPSPVPDPEPGTVSSDDPGRDRPFRLVATGDTVLSSTESLSANAGGLDALSLYSADGGGSRTALLQFDTSTLSFGSDQSAVLELKQLDGAWDNGPVEVAVVAVSQSWKEGSGKNVWASSSDGATYRSTGNGANWDTAGGDFNATYDFGDGANGIVSTFTLDGFRVDEDVVRVDVTSLVRAWSNGSLDNHGLALKVINGHWNEYLFASTESANDAHRPALVFSPGSPGAEEPAETSTSLPVVTVEDVAVQEGDIGTVLTTLEVSLSEVFESEIQLRYETFSGTATSGEDFRPQSGLVTIPSGKLTASFDLEIFGDDRLEPNEVFSVRLSDTNGTQTEASQADITILSDEFAPVPDPGQQRRIPASADTVLSGTESPISNVGGMESLSVFAADGGGERTALLQFDTSGLTTGDFQKVHLELHQQDGDWDNGPVDVSVFAVDQEWEEGSGTDPWTLAANGATFQSTGRGADWSRPGGDINTDFDFGSGANGVVGTFTLDGYAADSRVVRVDVTALVQAWLRGEIPNHGLALKITGGFWQEYLFASRESGESVGPSLVLS